MPLTLPPGEPAAGPWHSVPLAELIDMVLAAAGDPSGRPRIVAIDGRGASGKSTLANRVHRIVPASAIVHTDDVAWNEPLFAWGQLLADHVLQPLRTGRVLSYRPPQWDHHRRTGTIAVPAGLDLVVVEGTGASHREHGQLIDATIWVQADFAEAEIRGIARDVADGVNGGSEQAAEFWHSWMKEELAFMERQQPWRRACVTVNGTPRGSLDAGHVEIAPRPTPGP